MIRNDTDYALRMMVHLAEELPRRLTASELSALSGGSRGFAQKILRKLAGAGILNVRPGRRGGFHLNGLPGKVSLMDVIMAIQGPLLLNRCMSGPGACIRQPSCRISASLKGFQDKLEAFFCGTSLSDILGKTGGPVAKTANRSRHQGAGNAACEAAGEET